MKRKRKARVAHQEKIELGPLAYLRDTTAAQERVWTIADGLSKRAPWLLRQANLRRGWTVRLDGVPYRVEVVATLQLDRKNPFLFASVVIHAAQAGLPLRRVLLPTKWFRWVKSRLRAYRHEESVAAGWERLARVVQGTTEPQRLLGELQLIADTIECKSTPAVKNRPRYAEVREHGKQAEDVWAVLRAARTAGWSVAGIEHGVERKLRHKTSTWLVETRFSTMIDSVGNSPGFIAILGGTSNRPPRRGSANPVLKAMAFLDGAGYVRNASNQMQRGHRGLGPRTVQHEIELLEQSLQLLFT